MLTIALLLCSSPLDLFHAEMSAVKGTFLDAAGERADEIAKVDTFEADRIREQLKAFLADSSKVPTSPHLLDLRDKYIGRRAIAREKLLEALPDQREAWEARWEQEDTVEMPARRTKWLWASGSYYAVLHGKTWGEHNSKGVVAFRWQEVNRTAEYVELSSKRPGREYLLRLYEGDSYIRIGKIWETGKGKWVAQ